MNLTISANAKYKPPPKDSEGNDIITMHYLGSVDYQHYQTQQNKKTKLNNKL